MKLRNTKYGKHPSLAVQFFAPFLTDLLYGKMIGPLATCAHSQPVLSMLKQSFHF